jgi:hypothetical protein
MSHSLFSDYCHFCILSLEIYSRYFNPQIGDIIWVSESFNIINNKTRLLPSLYRVYDTLCTLCTYKTSPSRNVPLSKRPTLKTSHHLTSHSLNVPQLKMSHSQNVPLSKRPTLKTSHSQNVPRTKRPTAQNVPKNVPRHKTSPKKHPTAQNVPPNI